jgi:hypothetical protein
MFSQGLKQFQQQRRIIELPLHDNQRPSEISVRAPLRAVGFEFAEQLAHEREPLHKAACLPFGCHENGEILPIRDVHEK